MGILNRFSDIMRANVNDRLDKRADPERTIDEALVQAREDLAEVKLETAKVMAAERSAKSRRDDTKERAEREHGLAGAALRAGNEADARKFLASEAKIREQLAADEKSLAMAQQNTEKMRELYNKLATDIQDMEARKSRIRATMSMADATERLNSAGTPKRSASAAFEQYEDMANRRLDKAQAEAELNRRQGDGLDELREKYESQSEETDEALEALKKEFGIK
ncbi:MAG: PspA/IM30 family protein [Lachnospiraceae bacterium]|nr:PspA/IM30 family protein [Lachnospiraceae bacterium]